MKKKFGLYDDSIEKSSCGVGFLTRKDGKQSHKILEYAHEALCSVPHRGGMSSEGVGDGAGICIDLSTNFFREITSKKLKPEKFCVGNFFLPDQKRYHSDAQELIENTLKNKGMKLIMSRMIPVNYKCLTPASRNLQLLIKQWIFETPINVNSSDIEGVTHEALLDIEQIAFQSKKLQGLYPLSLSTKVQVLKGRLNSNELIPYFLDLQNKNQKIHSLYFHTRFSTNTDPHPSMAQPFRMMAHNGELNTDNKNRLSENAIFKARQKNIVRPAGQSDSCRFDQTLKNRIAEENLDIVSAIVCMMPPAWENNKKLSKKIRSMFEFFSLYEEKNDGPAAVIFGDGVIIGACLDRLGLRPLRTVETHQYVSVMSEAGQINFPESSVVKRGRIEAGGIFYYDHEKKKLFDTGDTYSMLAKKRDYIGLLKKHAIKISDININKSATFEKYEADLANAGRYVAYYQNQESLKFLIDPILENGVEKVSAMGYGNAINALSDSEGGMAKFFSHRFSQVTNPPLDPIRESDGMTLRMALGPKVNLKTDMVPQIVLDSPILQEKELNVLKNQKLLPVECFDFTYKPNYKNSKENEKALVIALKKLSQKVNNFVSSGGGIVVLSDRSVSSKRAAIPMILTVSAINQSLISAGLRFKTSIIVESGQISSPHHVACALGFGGSAVYSICSEMRSNDKFQKNKQKSQENFKKACEKSLMKIMGKVGLCTVESYSGGEFFESNFLNTNDPILKQFFPNISSPVGGVGFSDIAQSIVNWHSKSKKVSDESEIPIVGLFKERAEGAGHSYGLTAVRGFLEMTDEKIFFKRKKLEDHQENMRLLTLNKMYNSFGLSDKDFKNTNFEKLNNQQINKFKVTPGYRSFSKMLKNERELRPVALRDILSFPIDLGTLETRDDFLGKIKLFSKKGNNNFLFQNLVISNKQNSFSLSLKCDVHKKYSKHLEFSKALQEVFKRKIKIKEVSEKSILLEANSDAQEFLSQILSAPDPINLKQVQRASEITKTFASGAMSHGALVSSAHEAIAHGTNMVGAFSNSGEGGEHMSRYGTIRASKIKQLASGRFGVWAGYLADPMLEEIEIKIAQGAKPGEGGQLPATKVNVEIAAARNGTPGVELVSPPPHHDTYSIEDLAQLIHDAKAAKVRVIVKLVSSVGIGTIAVGVAKAGADVINIAGNTGGTGAANVTSLKYAGRAVEIGLSEVHQALCANNLREKIFLRCSGAHQTGSDVIKSAILGADSFEFGTTAMMMMKCVMAKNCNIKCPAGLTTNAEVFNGDARALAQFYLNVAHEVREILAKIGFKSLKKIRGHTNLLHLTNSSSTVGEVDLRDMLKEIKTKKVKSPIYLEKDFSIDDKFYNLVKKNLFSKNSRNIDLGKGLTLSNRNKTFGGQLSIDIERLINHEKAKLKFNCVFKSKIGRNFLDKDTITIQTKGSAGQSFGAFCNNGMKLIHTGTCNDGVGKSSCGGEIIIKNPCINLKDRGKQVLIGNFALFGSTGGRLFVEGQAGDRFAVRNSGAVSVIEGVGEYCAEYMTHGTILNLGKFSRGFGNGMSGGFAYQYDPLRLLADSISKESVFLNYLNKKSEISKMHENTIFNLLNWHLYATDSKKVKYLLKNWSVEKYNMAIITPKAFLQYQDYESILESKTRKDLIEELSEAMSVFQIEKFKKAWRKGEKILMGEVPRKKQSASIKKYELLNNWMVLDSAQKIALKNSKSENQVSDLEINEVVQNLILTEDFKLMNSLLRHSREAISHYSDKELAVMIANKRLNDFKKALTLRNVLGMESLSTYGWIIHQDRKNITAMHKIPDYEELFCNQILSDLVVNS